jgi:hypothetical protein
LLWPGGPPAVGQAGRGFLALATVGVGAGVGRAVGRGVGWAVGRGVGRGVGWAVGCGVGRAVGCAVGRGVGAGVVAGDGVGPPPGPKIGGFDAPGGGGVGVGPTATIGLLGIGVVDGPTEGSTDGVISGDALGSGDTGAFDPDEPVGAGPPVPGEAGAEPLGVDGMTEPVLPGVADGFPMAIPGLGWAGATKPAVSATVARTRFRRPMATTRRARWAEVTTTGALLQADRQGVPRGRGRW